MTVYHVNRVGYPRVGDLIVADRDGTALGAGAVRTATVFALRRGRVLAERNDGPGVICLDAAQAIVLDRRESP